MNNKLRLREMLIVLCLWMNPPIFSIDPVPWKDVRAMGLGQIYSSLPSFSNPAALSISREQQILFVYENRFLLKELSAFTACYEQPSRWIDFSLLVNYSGCDSYHETRCGLNVSKLLKPGLSLGVRLYYYNLQYAGNESSVSVFTADAGLQYEPVDNLLIGMLVSNPFRASFRQDDAVYRLPVSMEIGVRYRFSEAASVAFAAEKDTRFPVCFKFGLSYEIDRQLELRIGMFSSPLQPTAGIGYRMEHFGLQIAYAYHPVLGSSPSVAIHYYF